MTLSTYDRSWWEERKLPLINGVLERVGMLTSIDFQQGGTRRDTEMTLDSFLQSDPGFTEVTEFAQMMFDGAEVSLGGGAMGGDGFVVLMRNQEIAWMLVSDVVNPMMGVVRAGEDLQVINNCGDILRIPLQNPAAAEWLV